jgi:putative ATPase
VTVEPDAPRRWPAPDGIASSLICWRSPSTSRAAGNALIWKRSLAAVRRWLSPLRQENEQFYDQISALHKAVRGTDPDAALYWLCRMLDGGCDPRYIARRVLRMASEDIGNADPRALTLALQAAEAYERLGSPEGELALAQAVVFMACAAKSNAVYVAFNAAIADAQRLGTLDVPLHLRNAPTRLMKGLGYGTGYRYAHDDRTPSLRAGGFPGHGAARYYARAKA